MLAVRTIAQLPLWVLGPLRCRLGHHKWHAWLNGYAGPIKVCVRCHDIHDPQTRRGTR